jgi:hypothetical protein
MSLDEARQVIASWLKSIDIVDLTEERLKVPHRVMND